MVFTQILEKTLAFEGGWSNHPNDKGGATQYGVTQSTLDAYLAQEHQSGFNTDENFPQHVSELTEEDAAHIYKEIFFNKPQIALTSHQIDFFLPVLPNEKVIVISEKIYFRFNKLKCAVKMMNTKNELVCRGEISGMIIPNNNE